MSKESYKLLNFKVYGDEDGKLCPLYFEQLPFKPKRAYFIYSSKIKRGGHAHKKEEEVFVCIAGSFRARIHDGKKWRTYKLYKPGKAIYTDKMIWHEFDDFSEDGVMLAISSTVYNGTKDYIMDFAEFIKRK